MFAAARRVIKDEEIARKGGRKRIASRSPEQDTPNTQ
jgi:hypothetical protein